MRSRRPALSVVLLCGLAGACGRQAATDAPPPAAPTITVTAAVVAGVDEAVAIEAPGSFAAAETSDVAPETSGRVSQTLVDVGSFVQTGDPLVRVQSVNAELRLDEARAAVTRADAALKLAESRNALAQLTAGRYATLLASGNVAQTMADQARTEAESSMQSVNTARATRDEMRAQLAIAEKAVVDVAVTAPFAGFISARHVSTGEYVQPSTAVVTLVSLDPLRLRLTVPAAQAGQVAVGQLVEARVDGYPDRVFTGRLTAINPSISPESRALGVEARVPNPEARLKPGMFAVARIDLGRLERVLVAPRRALMEDANTNSYRVYVIDPENRARLRVVQLAARQPADAVRIVAGVLEGDRVATSNLADLYDGAPVAITADGGR